MKKDIRDYLHLYMGCNCILPDFSEKINNIKFKLTAYNYNYYKDWHSEIQPILRPLSSMTEEEAVELILILTNSNPELEDKIDADEIILELAPNDGGNFVDGDMAIVLDYSCRCFEGQLGIRECGSLILHDSDSGKQQILTYVPEGFRFLLRKGFDLFGLIESGLALDITKQPVQ